MKKFPACLLIMIASVLSCFSQSGNNNNTKERNEVRRIFRYTNPITRDTAISMRDHFIIKAENKWYCVGTSNPVWEGPNPGVRLLASDDLINWTQHSWLIDASKLPPDCPLQWKILGTGNPFHQKHVLPDRK